MGIDKAWEDVRAFHLAFGRPAPEQPELLHADLVERRANWIDEAAEELREAETVADQADAFIDIIYAALGGLVNLGVRPERLWDIVHSGSMARLWPDGAPRLRPGDGEPLKPDDWKDPAPLLQAEIERQRREGALAPLRPRRAKVA